MKERMERTERKERMEIKKRRGYLYFIVDEHTLLSMCLVGQVLFSACKLGIPGIRSQQFQQFSQATWPHPAFKYSADSLMSRYMGQVSSFSSAGGSD